MTNIGNNLYQENMVFIKRNNLIYCYRDKTDSQDLSTKNNVVKISQIFRELICGLGSNCLNTCYQQYAAKCKNYGKSNKNYNIDSGRSSDSTKRIEFNNSRIKNNNTCDNQYENK